MIAFWGGAILKFNMSLINLIFSFYSGIVFFFSFLNISEILITLLVRINIDIAKLT